MLRRTSPRAIREELDRIGFKRSFWTRWSALMLVGGTVVLAVAATTAEWRNDVMPGTDPHELGGALLGVGAFCIAFRQWIAARQEISLDKFYDRLDRANRALADCHAARTIIEPAWRAEEVYQRAMYTCIELDNLEYAIEKYAMGYMDSRDAARALHTFVSRCTGSAEFQRLVRECVTTHGYNQSTRAVVAEILQLPETRLSARLLGGRRHGGHSAAGLARRPARYAGRARFAHAHAPPTAPMNGDGRGPIAPSS